MQEDKARSRLQFSQEDAQELAAHKAKRPSARLRSEKADFMDTGQQARFDPMTRSHFHPCSDGQSNPSIAKAQRKAVKASNKLEKAQSKLPKQKRIAIARATDAATGKTAIKLHFDEKVKPPSKLNHEGIPTIGAEIHRQIDKDEDENSGVKAAHSTEKNAEKGVHLANSSYRTSKLKSYRHVEKAEQALDKTNLRVQYQKAQLSSNPVSRWQQKRAIRKSYAAAKAAGSFNQSTATGALNVVDRAKAGVKAIVTRNKKSMVLGGLLFFMLAMLMNGLSSCTPMIQGGLQALVIATYPAEDADILAA